MANNTEQIGVNHIGEIAARNKWMFRPQPIVVQNLSCFLRRTLEQPFPQSYNPNNLKRKTLPVLSRKYIIDSGGSVFA